VRLESGPHLLRNSRRHEVVNHHIWPSPEGLEAVGLFSSALDTVIKNNVSAFTLDSTLGTVQIYESPRFRELWNLRAKYAPVTMSSTRNYFRHRKADLAFAHCTLRRISLFPCRKSRRISDPASPPAWRTCSASYPDQDTDGRRIFSTARAFRKAFSISANESTGLALP